MWFFYHHWYKTTKVETWNCPSREPGTSWVWVQHCQSHYICLDKSSSLEQWWKRYLSKGKGICLGGLVNDISYDVYVCIGTMKKGTRGSLHPPRRSQNLLDYSVINTKCRNFILSISTFSFIQATKLLKLSMIDVFQGSKGRNKYFKSFCQILNCRFCLM